MTQNMLQEIFELSAIVVSKASNKNLSIATAESCTGGLIGAAITASSGSSKVFRGGIIAYHNDIKCGLLDVSPATLETHGAVSEDVATQMAKGALNHLGTDIAISVTGIAGPGGGSIEKPVGTVWIGIATHEDVRASRYLYSDLSRNKVRDATCSQALKTIISALDNAF